jgi:lipopolysaccharide biosynthesis glycosyltransferase
MYVLHSDITTEKQKLLQDIVAKKNNAALQFINTDGFLKDEWASGSFNTHWSNSKFTLDTIIRCFGAKFFPQYDKIIYSDVDVIFTDDISELWDVDLTDKYIAGVKGVLSKYSPDELSHLKPEHYAMLHDKYISGGIWVMNLKKIREDNLEDKMLEVIKDDTIIKRWNDQDIVNIACGGKVGFIPLNYISYPYLIDLLVKPDFVSDASREELYDSLINPKIIHFASTKPWNNTPKYSNLWWTYFHYLGLQKTKIFKDYNPKVAKMKKYKKRCLMLEILIAILLIIAIIVLLLK